jgi:prolyl-tRNA editing enzyme YbaK/EbsC (Cys-tRNA(Pro) deacylase)
VHRNALRVEAELRRLGVEPRIVEHETSARTAEEAAATVGVPVGAIVKSLVFVAGSEPLLVLTSGSNRVSTDRLRAELGVAVRRGDADDARRATGFPIGGVAPVAHPAPVRTLVDRDLLGFPEVWAAAGTPHAVFPITPAELVRVTDATVADVAE